jgi:hypothetical protein
MILPLSAKSQLMNHYWTMNFNSESSLLSGAVVAGDAGNASIYFNPANISEIKKGSNLSFAASLFSWGIYSYRNALGDDIHMTGINFNVIPQFLSYSFRSNDSKLSFAVTAITRLKESIDLDYYNSRQLDVLSEIPGKENYSTSYTYQLNYIDNWIGLAGAYDLSERFKVGTSLFISIAQLNYKNLNSAVAFSPTDTIWVDNIPNPSFVAEGSYNESYRFNHVRLIGKIGFSYILDRWRFGLNITTESVPLFSVKNEALRTQRVSDITNPETGEYLHGYVITNGLVGSDLNTRLKYPSSVSAGFIFDVEKDKKRLYFTVEYFSRINPYRMVQAPIRDDITSSIVYDRLKNKDWLSVADASREVFNVAIAYRWKLKRDLLFMNGFRTDFNNVKNVNYGQFNDLNKINTTNFDIYHYNAGFQFYLLKKYQMIAGGELSFGYATNLEQVANYSHPVEYNPDDNRILQGPLQKDMDIYYFGFNIYLGITLNFQGKKHIAVEIKN